MTDTVATPSTPDQASIAEKLELARKDLLDLTLRNPLLNHRPSRRRGLRIVDESPTEVYRILVQEGRPMSFLPAQKAAEGSSMDVEEFPQELLSFLSEDDQKQPEARHVDTRLQTPHGKPNLELRLSYTERDARASIDEQGVNILYLVLGMLKWFESDSSEEVRQAPLILAPAALDRTDARAHFRLRYTKEEITENLSLKEKLRQDFGIVLPDLGNAEDIDVGRYFRQVEEVAASQDRWSVDEGALQLGFFSFHKLLIFKDLDRESWPKDRAPSDHPTVRSLFDGQGFREPGSPVGDDDFLDDHLQISDTHHVLDSDSSQTLTVVDVKKGRHLVVEGPPGTGKSQTITNLIAEAICDGKKVLFVAEKMAALDVVKRRLDETRIGDACLELHSHKASKGAVVQELKRTCDLGRPSEEIEDHAVLAADRQRLNDYCRAVNAKVNNSDLSAHDIYGRLLRLDLPSATERPAFAIESVDVSWTRFDFETRADTVRALRKLVKATGPAKEHPFWLSGRRSLLPADRNAIQRKLAKSAIAVHRVRDAVDHLSLRGVQVEPGWAACRNRYRASLDEIRRLAKLRVEYEPLLRPHAWDTDLRHHREPISKWRRRWWRFLSGSYRSARNHLADLCRGDLPTDGATQLEIIDAIMAAQWLRETVAKTRLLQLLDSMVSGDAADWLALAEAASQCISALDKLSSALDALNEALEFRPERLPKGTALAERDLDDLEAWLQRAQQEFEALGQIVQFNQHEARLTEYGIGELAEIASHWKGAGAHLAQLFEHTWLSALVAQAFEDHPRLAEFDGDTHQNLIARFRQCDHNLCQYNQARVAQSHWEGLPGASGGGQLGVLLFEFAKKRRHLPLRQLMEKAGRAILQIKPVFMMSPLSIAKFLPPGSVDFDLVIFDEASQVRPVDALGAILRAGQAVVVGDSQQLPPTSFFDRLVKDDSDEEQSPADIESILGLFRAAHAPRRMLRWHYRSQHESLIAVSNHLFYENRLVIFPSPDRSAKHTGLRFHHDPSNTYEQGKRFNVGEARAVADAVMAHAHSSPDLTLGVAAFGIPQARLIEDEVEIRRRKDPSTECFFMGHPEEPFFVKNLENVQGDERDVVFVSVGYGRIESGALPMTFGPLNQGGGERRLNVLITRARRRLEVHANFTAADLDSRGIEAQGVTALRTFLHYAETGNLDLPEPSGRGPDSPFEEEVARALRDRGHDVVHQIGSTGFFIDLGVVDPQRPGRYLLGIECDGATYHSHRSARDRDRLRQQVLEARGWTIHRVWSTDWSDHPERELEKAENAIRCAAAVVKRDVPPQPPTPAPLERGCESKASSIPPDQDHRPYEVASISVQLGLPGIPQGALEIHEVPDETLCKWILEVVQVESPVHIDETAFRIASAFGLKRAGPRIRARLRVLAQKLGRDGRLLMKDGFLWRIDHRQMEFFRRRDDNLPSRLRKPEMIAPEEIGVALRRATQASFGIVAADAISEASRLFGFKRAGAEIRATFATVLERLVEHGELEQRGDQLHHPK